MQEMLQQILVELKENKESIKKLEKQLMVEIQETKKSVNQLEKQMDKRFKEFEIKMDKKFDEHTKLFDKKLDRQTSEISQELQNIVIYFDKKIKKQDKINDALLKELRENRIEHESYNSRLYKIEVAQSNVKNQVNELARQQGIAI